MDLAWLILVPVAVFFGVAFCVGIRDGLRERERNGGSAILAVVRFVTRGLWQATPLTDAQALEVWSNATALRNLLVLLAPIGCVGTRWLGSATSTAVVVGGAGLGAAGLVHLAMLRRLRLGGWHRRGLAGRR